MAFLYEVVDGRNVIETNILRKYTDFGRGLKLHGAFTVTLGKE